MPLFAHVAVQAALATASREQARKISDEAAKAYLAEGKAAGFSIAVSRRGKLLYAHGFGARKIEGRATSPATAATIYRLASVSKPITALLVLSIVEKGRLNLDEDVRRTLPTFPDKGAAITARMVLGHLSGIRHYQEGKEDGGARFATSQAALSVWQDDPLLFAPGERYSYSTHAYTLLGALIERKTQLAYDRFLDRKRREWTGRATPRAEDRNRDRGSRSDLFAAASAGFETLAADDLSWKRPGGGLEATAPDLCALGDAVLAGRVLSRETLREMWTAQTPKEGTSHYGMGFAIGDGFVDHSGSQEGARSYWRLDPRTGIVVAVLSNVEGNPIQPLCARICDAWSAVADEG